MRIKTFNMPEILSAQTLEKLEIKKPMQGIVSTSMLQDGNGILMYIKEGSILYSGVTGEQVGTLKSRLKFPLNVKTNRKPFKKENPCFKR